MVASPLQTWFRIVAVFISVNQFSEALLRLVMIEQSIQFPLYNPHATVPLLPCKILTKINALVTNPHHL